MWDWILANKELLVTCVFLLIALCTAICKFTPSEKDDGVMAKIFDIIDNMSLAKRPRDRQIVEAGKAILNGEEKKNA